MQSQAAHFPKIKKINSKTHPEDAGKAGQDPQGEDGGAGFHTAGPTDVAQGGLAAAGGDSSYADVQVDCWAKCRAFLGDSLARVTAGSCGGIAGQTILLVLRASGGAETMEVGSCIFAREAGQGGSTFCAQGDAKHDQEEKLHPFRGLGASKIIRTQAGQVLYLWSVCFDPEIITRGCCVR